MSKYGNDIKRYTYVYLVRLLYPCDFVMEFLHYFIERIPLSIFFSNQIHITSYMHVIFYSVGARKTA